MLVSNTFAMLQIRRLSDAVAAASAAAIALIAKTVALCRIHRFINAIAAASAAAIALITQTFPTVEFTGPVARSPRRQLRRSR